MVGERIRTSGPYVPNVELTHENGGFEPFSAQIGREQAPNGLAT